MKIKLQTANDKPITSPISRFTIYCQAKKVKEILPKTPVKKVAVIEKLIDSPSTSGTLKKRGVMVGKDVDVKKKLEIADGYVKTVRKDISISDLKLQGTQPINEKVKYTTFVQTALMSISRKYNIRLVLDIGKHHKRGNQWTTLEELKKRQRRKDTVSDDVRRRRINFYLSPDISRKYQIRMWF